MAGVNKSSDLEYKRRLRIVQEWILADVFQKDIINKCVESWGISEFQAKRYIKTASVEFTKVMEKDMKKNLAYHIEKRKKLIRQISADEKHTARGVRVELDIVKDIAELQGLYVKKHEVTGKDGKAIEIEQKSDIDYSKLSDEALEEIINAKK